jgi:hypothetical protein
MKILVTEEQLKTVAITYFKSDDMDKRKTDFQLFKESWNKLNNEERELVIELYKVLYPTKSKKLYEGVMDWVQGGLDVVGIFDPTGIADLTNAVLYFGRGEILFGMLSLVSIIPVAGDMIAKPIILGGKALGVPFKAFKAAVASGDAAKIAKSAKAMEKMGPTGKKIVEFIESFNKGLGEKISNLLKKGKNIPIVNKFTTTIENWIKVFKKASNDIKLPTKSSKFEIPAGTAGVWKGTLKGSEKVDFMEVLRQMMKPGGKGYSTTAFREMAKKGKFKFLGKEFTKIWQVPAHRKMLGRTKLYLRFLDTLGLANFIGPDELMKQDPSIENKFANYVDSPQGQAAFNEEFVNSSDMQNYYNTSTTPSTTTNTDKISNMSSILGIKNITPEIQNVLSQFLKTAI